MVQLIHRIQSAFFLTIPSTCLKTAHFSYKCSRTVLHLRHKQSGYNVYQSNYASIMRLQTCLEVFTSIPFIDMDGEFFLRDPVNPSTRCNFSVDQVL